MVGSGEGGNITVGDKVYRNWASPDWQVPEGHRVVHEVAWEERGQGGSARAALHPQETFCRVTKGICSLWQTQPHVQHVAGPCTAVHVGLGLPEYPGQAAATLTILQVAAL